MADKKPLWIRRRGLRTTVDGQPVERKEILRRRRSYQNVTDAIRDVERNSDIPGRDRLHLQPREYQPRGRRRNDGTGFLPFPFRRRGK